MAKLFEFNSINLEFINSTNDFENIRDNKESKEKWQKFTSNIKLCKIPKWFKIIDLTYSIIFQLQENFISDGTNIKQLIYSNSKCANLEIINRVNKNKIIIEKTDSNPNFTFISFNKIK